MIKVYAYEFKDLDKPLQDKIKSKILEMIIQDELESLHKDLYHNVITEKQYYKELNCSKNYVEMTSWFIPNCYYEKYKDRLEKSLKLELEVLLFDKLGTIIYSERVKND